MLIEGLEEACVWVKGREPEAIGLFGFGEVPGLARGMDGAGRDAPGAIAEIEDAGGVDLSGFDGVGTFEGVIVVLEGGAEAVAFKEGDPGAAHAGGARIGESVAGGEGGDVVGGEFKGNLGALGEFFL